MAFLYQLKAMIYSRLFIFLHRSPISFEFMFSNFEFFEHPLRNIIFGGNFTDTLLPVDGQAYLIIFDRVILYWQEI